jgi:hypothetical protein
MNQAFSRSPFIPGAKTPPSRQQRQAIRERSRHVATLFLANAGNEFQILHRCKGLELE